jgi:hypothetical protein
MVNYSTNEEPVRIYVHIVQCDPEWEHNSQVRNRNHNQLSVSGECLFIFNLHQLRESGDCHLILTHHQLKVSGDCLFIYSKSSSAQCFSWLSLYFLWLTIGSMCQVTVSLFILSQHQMTLSLLCAQYYNCFNWEKIPTVVTHKAK